MKSPKRPAGRKGTTRTARRPGKAPMEPFFEIDPFQWVIDMQLQSLCGLLERAAAPPKPGEGQRRAPYVQVVSVTRTYDAYARKEAVENALIGAYDRKYRPRKKSVEERVVELLLQGHTDREIARLLALGKGTVHRIKKVLRDRERAA